MFFCLLLAFKYLDRGADHGNTEEQYLEINRFNVGLQKNFTM